MCCSPTLRLVVLGFLVLAGSLATPAAAWNRPTHMVTGAIAYQELAERDPATAANLVALLEQHPAYLSRWKSRLQGLDAQQRAERLFMLAARWPDDIRDDGDFQRYHRTRWHFVNLPYKPPGEPASLRTREPYDENILAALDANLRTLSSARDPADGAVALSWLLHLVGDIHQPLHVVQFFSRQFPDGDRGGNEMHVRTHSRTRTTNLHALWDGLILRRDEYRDASQLATELRRSYKRQQLDELGSDPRAWKSWAQHESLPLAREAAYLEGELEVSRDRDHGTRLPSGYLDSATAIAKRRVALAGYRLADLLASID